MTDLPILKEFTPVDLKEIDKVKLQKRVDSKYLVPVDDLIKILAEITDIYNILLIKGNIISSYETQYFDTPDLNLHRKHQNGKLNRLKVRKRKYVESNISFLEAKFKSNKSVTIKNRFKQEVFDLGFTESDTQLLADLGYDGLTLTPSLFNSFNRITLASLEHVERCTIDLNLAFKFGGNETQLKHACIIEVKQEKFNLNSPLIQAIKKYHYRKTSFSKYCVGMCLMDDSIKYNNFKPRILELNKIENGTTD